MDDSSAATLNLLVRGRSNRARLFRYGLILFDSISIGLLLSQLQPALRDPFRPLKTRVWRVYRA